MSWINARLHASTIECAVLAILLCPHGVAAQAQFDTLHSFSSEGEQPTSPLMLASDGNFYGTTSRGSVGNLGTIFRMTPGGTVTVLYVFAGGAYSGGALTQGSDGSLYGVAGSSGSVTCGSVFRMTLSGEMSVLHAFTGPPDGCNPAGPLVQAIDGKFYGTTARGGASNRGTVYSMTASGDITVVHAFDGSDSRNPTSGVVQATDGNFYGVTGDSAFRMTPAGNLTVLHTFSGSIGVYPQGPLIQATDGALYGTAIGATVSAADLFDPGSVFRISLDGSFDVLHVFDGPEGLRPAGPLLQASDGNFYGVAGSEWYIGRPDTIFKMTPAGALTILQTFPTHPMWADEGVGGVGGLVEAADGRLYGVQRYGLPNGNTSRRGSIFRLNPRVAPAGRSTVGDFDGDRRSEITVYRPGTGQWFVLQSSGNFRNSKLYQWGGTGDVPVPGDYDGDGRTDPSVYRPSTGQWFVLRSTDNYAGSSLHQWGGSSDVPVPGDYDGDGKFDPAVYRPSTGQWFVLRSDVNYAGSSLHQWGAVGDLAVPSDYDGDGKIDPAVYRPATGHWFILKSTSNYAASNVYQWGAGADKPILGDFDGDGRGDITVYRRFTGQWFVLSSSSAFANWTLSQLGGPGDLPVSGDFDGDGKSDIAVYRPGIGLSTGQWIALMSSTNGATTLTRYWGAPGDIPSNVAAP